MRPISYELNGFPEFLRSDSACRKAIERGNLQPDTSIIAYGDNGLRERMLAEQHPLLREMFSPDPAPDELIEHAFTEPSSSADAAQTDAPAETLQVEAAAAAEPESAEPPPTDPQPSIGTGAKIGCTVAAILALLTLISTCDRSPSNTTESVTSATSVADAAEDAAAEPVSQTYYAVRTISVRKQAAKNSEQVIQLPRNTQFNGYEVPSVSQNGFFWLRITDGPYAGNFVSMLNLSAESRVDLDTGSAGYYYISEQLTPLDAPKENAAIKADPKWNLSPGTKVEVAGVTGGGMFSTGWAEIMLENETGVGYVPFDKLTGAAAYDAAATASAAAAAGAAAADAAAGQTNAGRNFFIKNDCNNDLRMMFRYRTTGGWASQVVRLRARRTTKLEGALVTSDEVYFLNLANMPDVEYAEGTGSVASVNGRTYSLNKVIMYIDPNAGDYRAGFGTPCT